MKRTLIILGLFFCFLPAVTAKEIKGIVTDTDSTHVEFANITAFATHKLF